MAFKKNLPVDEIRELIVEHGYTASRLADKYDVSKETVRRAIREIPEVEEDLRRNGIVAQKNAYGVARRVRK